MNLADYKVLLTDRDPFPDLKIQKEILSEINAELVECKTEEDIQENIEDADAVMVAYYEITPELVDKMNNVKIISRTGIGVNNIPLEVAKKKDIYVTNVPAYCVDEVSSHTIGLLLGCARKIPQLNKNVKEKGKWSFQEFLPIYRIKGGVLGLISFGKIAQDVAKKAQGLGLEVIAYDPYMNKEEMKKLDVEKVEFEELLRKSDYLSIHSPLTEETRGMMGEKEFELMKEKAFVINTARGAIIDEKALIEAVKNNQIAGAGLDVLESEGFNANNPLFGLDNVIMTPHSAFYSEGALKELQRSATEEIVRVLQGKEPKCCVNC